MQILSVKLQLLISYHHQATLFISQFMFSIDLCRNAFALCVLLQGSGTRVRYSVKATRHTLHINFSVSSLRHTVALS